MAKEILLLVSFTFILFSGAAGAEVDVVENKCTDEQSHEKEKGCAHMFLEQMTQPSANCSAELMKYKECFKNFTLNKCFGDYIKAHPDMKIPIGRMADIKTKLHRFGRMMCGIIDGPINTTGLPDKVKHMLKCKPEFYDKAKDCAKAFYDKYVANRESTDLCKSYMEAKMCGGELMKVHCTYDKPPPRDHFNPFCPNNMDPPKGSAANTCISVTLTLMGLVFYLFL